MKEKRSGLILLFITIIMILLALAAESVYFSDFEYHFRTGRFNKILSEKEKLMEGCLNSLQLILDKGENLGSITERNIFSLA